LALSEKLKELKLTIGTKAGSNGKIFGSITPLQVSQSLKNLGYEIDRRKIEVDDIKLLGSYEAIVNLHRDVVVPISIEVVSE
jgi:large subunit ribosomal protein L9